jgi:hypothetical protein
LNMVERDRALMSARRMNRAERCETYLTDRAAKFRTILKTGLQTEN